MRQRFVWTPVLLAIAFVSTVVTRTALSADLGNPFTFELGRSSPTGETAKRFDILSGAGDWMFQVTATGNVNTLVLSIRDASPGDFCWFWTMKKPKGTFTVTAEDMPAAVPNACPGTQFGDDDDELAFLAGFQGGKNGHVTITVAYPAP